MCATLRILFLFQFSLFPEKGKNPEKGKKDDLCRIFAATKHT
jgi:hypothetical protein